MIFLLFVSNFNSVQIGSAEAFLMVVIFSTFGKVFSTCKKGLVKFATSACGIGTQRGRKPSSNTTTTTNPAVRHVSLVWVVLRVVAVCKGQKTEDSNDNTEKTFHVQNFLVFVSEIFLVLSGESVFFLSAASSMALENKVATWSFGSKSCFQLCAKQCISCLLLKSSNRQPLI